MALGCPVICSPVASLPEVAGDAAHMVDLRPETYLEAIRDLSRDSAQRREMSEAGRRQAAQFSWLRCARETLEVYKTTVSSGTHP
jgi:alpha-1,3-rhamnosyl/mannosyltransferase